MWSFACGSMIVNVCLWITRFAYELYRFDCDLDSAWESLPSFHLKKMWLQGVLMGALYSCGNFCSIIAVTYLGQGVGYSFIQSRCVRNLPVEVPPFYGLNKVYQSIKHACLWAVGDFQVWRNRGSHDGCIVANQCLRCYSWYTLAYIRACFMIYDIAANDFITVIIIEYSTTAPFSSVFSKQQCTNCVWYSPSA